MTPAHGVDFNFQGEGCTFFTGVSYACSIQFAISTFVMCGAHLSLATLLSGQWPSFHGKWYMIWSWGFQV
jgi:hypothetical protein